jgi:surface polysaccharide O-acyltransferase-like enzyme
MSQNSLSQRSSGLDLIKSLGLLLVIFYHISGTPDILSSGSLLTGLGYFFYPFLSCCVPLFFMVSGALALSRPIALRKNTLRCAHLLVITLLWLVICLSAVLWLRGERVSLSEFWDIAAELRVGYVQHLWYLPNFLFLCALLPVLQSLKTHTPKIYGYFLLLILVLTFGNMLLSDLEYLLRWVLGKRGYQGYRSYFWYPKYFDYHYWYSFVYFALGDYMFSHREPLGGYRKYCPWTILLSIGALALIGAAKSYVRGSLWDTVFYNYSDPFALVLTASVYLLLQNVQMGPRLRNVTGSLATCSLGIYVTHWLFLEALRQAFPQLMESPVWALPLSILVLLFSWCLSLLCLRIPVARNLFTASPGWVKKYSQAV